MDDLCLVDEVVDGEDAKDSIIRRMAGAVEEQGGRGSAVDHFEAAITKSVISMKGRSFEFLVVFFMYAYIC